MPYRKKYRKRIKRRRRKRSVPRQLITNRFTRTFKFVENFTLNPSAGTADVQTWSANGMYKPDATGTKTHQPLGFDQLVGIMYDHYTVIGAKCKLYFSTDGTSGSSAAYRVGCAIRDTAGYTGSINTLIEQGRTNFKTVGPIGSDSQVIVTNKVGIGKFLGRSSVMSDPELKGSVSANPAEQAYFVCWAAGIDHINDPGAIYVTAEIEYMAVLTEPRMLAGS